MNTKISRILIVDDDLDLCQSLMLILNRQGFETASVQTGLQAREKVLESTFDLILIDMVMPELNGLETLKVLNEIAPNTRMVMMTGFAVAGLVAQAIQAGVDGVLYKPFNVDIVINNLVSNDILQLFEGYLQTVWERIVPVVGTPTAQLIFSQSVEKIVREAGAILEGAEVTEAGFTLTGIRAQAESANDSGWGDLIRPHLQHLLAEVFDLLSMLTGDMLISPLIEELSTKLKGQK